MTPEASRIARWDELKEQFAPRHGTQGAARHDWRAVGVWLDPSVGIPHRLERDGVRCIGFHLLLANRSSHGDAALSNIAKASGTSACGAKDVPHCVAHEATMHG